MDKFIEENNRKKALKLVYKELTDEISKEIVRAKRDIRLGNLPIPKNHLIIILGVDQFNILTDAAAHLGNELGLDLSDYDEFDVDPSSCIKIYGFPVYVSQNDKSLIKVIVSASHLLCESFTGLPYENEWWRSNSDERLKNYISKLPDNSKFRRVEEKEVKA